MQYLSGGWKGVKYGTLSAGIGAIIYTKYVDSGPYTTLYKLCLKTFNPDTVHKLNKVFISMGLIHKVDQSIYKGVLDQNLGQLYLPNILGLAAGYEADGNITKDLVDMGFGYVEIGSLNPQLDVESKAQLENNKILAHQQRVEYNRDIDNLTILKPQAYVGSLKRNNDQSKQKYVIGANISPNAEAKLYTPYLCEQDFITGGQEALQFSDYVVLNLQGPQSKGIEHLLNTEKMKEIIDEIKKERTLLYAKQAVFEYEEKYHHKIFQQNIENNDPKTKQDEKNKQQQNLQVKKLGISDVYGTPQLLHDITTPYIFLKLNDQDQLEILTKFAKEYKQIGIEGLVIVNQEKQNAEKNLRKISSLTNGQLPLISVGNIQQPQDVIDRIKNGANSVQICSQFYLKGPKYVQTFLDQLKQELNKQNFNSIRQVQNMDIN